ncbi:MAG: class I SAM-dependent methyltransferase [Chloroflexota bacterium]
MSIGNDERRLYDDLAWLFPFTSAPEDFSDLVEGAYALIKARLATEPRTLLHLGAGAGHIDHTLKRHVAVTGVDVSEKMLAMAAELNPEVTYLLGDMRTARLGKTYDVVLLDDAITYMLSEDDLRAAFLTAWTHLRPGGVAVAFVEVTRESFAQHRTTCSTRTRADLEVTQVENFYDPDPGDTTCEVTLVYLVRRAGQLEVVTDRHLLGVFPRVTWQRLPRDLGFAVEDMELPTGQRLYLYTRPAGAT